MGPGLLPRQAGWGTRTALVLFGLPRLLASSRIREDPPSLSPMPALRRRSPWTLSAPIGDHPVEVLKGEALRKVLDASPILRSLPPGGYLVVMGFLVW